MKLGNATNKVVLLNSIQNAEAKIVTLGTSKNTKSITYFQILQINCGNK